MSHTFVIFGASGDLTRRKLIPALYRSAFKQSLPIDTRIVGVSRTQFDDAGYRESLVESSAKFSEFDFDKSAWDEFAQRIHYVPGDMTKVDDFRSLRSYLDKLDAGRGTRVYYLATLPSLYERRN